MIVLAAYSNYFIGLTLKLCFNLKNFIKITMKIELNLFLLFHSYYEIKWAADESSTRPGESSTDNTLN